MPDITIIRTRQRGGPSTTAKRLCQGLSKEAELVTLLDQTLQRLEVTAHLFQGEEEELDPKLQEQLRALGYIQ